MMFSVIIRDDNFQFLPKIEFNTLNGRNEARSIDIN